MSENTNWKAASVTDSQVQATEWRPTPPEEIKVAPHAGPAFDEALYRWELYRSASSPIQQARALVALDDAMSDLATFHPDFDEFLGEVRREEL